MKESTATQMLESISRKCGDRAETAKSASRDKAKSKEQRASLSGRIHAYLEIKHYVDTKIMNRLKEAGERDQK